MYMPEEYNKNFLIGYQFQYEILRTYDNVVDFTIRESQVRLYTVQEFMSLPVSRQQREVVELNGEEHKQFDLGG